MNHLDIISANEAHDRAMAYIKAHPLRPEWCKCENGTFDSYPGDGQCKCGIIKHHVHCQCGGVLQIG